MIDLLLPTRTLALPVNIPLTTTILGVGSFSLTAAVNSGRVETVVTEPPFPPVVLFQSVILCQAKREDSPAVDTCVAKGSRIRDSRTLEKIRCGSVLVCGRCRRRSSNAQEPRENGCSFHGEGVESSRVMLVNCVIVLVSIVNRCSPVKLIYLTKSSLRTTQFI